MRAHQQSKNFGETDEFFIGNRYAFDLDAAVVRALGAFSSHKFFSTRLKMHRTEDFSLLSTFGNSRRS